MIEPEMAFYDLEDDMDLQEDFVKYLLNWALTKCREDLEFFDKRIKPGLIAQLESVVKSKFVRISYPLNLHPLISLKMPSNSSTTPSI